MVARKVIPIAPAESLIPEGLYCYTPVEAPCAANNWVFRVRPCPFWEAYSPEKHGPLPEDLATLAPGESPGAYCRYLKAGDWTEGGTWLLWDLVKECGVRDDYDEGAELC